MQACKEEVRQKTKYAGFQEGDVLPCRVVLMRGTRDLVFGYAFISNMQAPFDRADL